MKNYQNGFGAIGIISIIAAIIISAAVGWIAYKEINHRNKSDSNNTQSGVSANKNSSSTSSQSTKDNTYKMSGVSFTMPSGWYVDDDNIAPYFKYQLQEVSIIPGEKLRTIYGDGTEYFHIYVAVYAKQSTLSSSDWFEGNNNGDSEGVAEGILMNGDTESHDSINGYDTYYRHIDHGGYQEVHYVLADSEKYVYVTARTYETTASLHGVGDFLKFEPQIDQMVHTISIQ